MILTKQFVHFSFYLVCCLLIGGTTGWSQQAKSSGLSFVDMVNDTIRYPGDAPGSGVLLLYFHPDCPECVQTVRRLKSYAAAYPVPIWLISAADLEQLRVFESMLGLYDTDNLRVLQDYSGIMHDHFDIKWLPHVVLLNGRAEIMQQFDRVPPPDAIRKWLSEK